MRQFASTSRRSFLGNVGRTLVVGFGVAAVPSVAGASNRGAEGSRATGRFRFRCCTATRRCGSCGGNQVKYYCTSDSCPNGFCTVCRDFNGDCFNVERSTCP